MKQLKRTLHWLLFNGIIAVAAYGMATDIAPLANLLLFLVWLCAVVDTIVVFNAKAMERIKTTPRAVPSWLRLTLDITVLGILAMSGHFLTAVAQIWVIVCEFSIYEQKTEPEATNAQS